MALGMRFRLKEAKRLAQVKDDRGFVGVSMELTMRRAPRFGDLLAGFMMNSNVALTSVAVSARPSWKRTPWRRWKT